MAKQKSKDKEALEPQGPAQESQASEAPEAPEAPAPKRDKAEVAEAPAPASDAPAAPAADQSKKAPGKKRVKALVNMSCHDGTQLLAGKHVELSPELHAQLKSDSRGPMFEE
jgi:hypothetical protein